MTTRTGYLYHIFWTYPWEISGLVALKVILVATLVMVMRQERNLSPVKLRRRKVMLLGILAASLCILPGILWYMQHKVSLRQVSRPPMHAAGF